MKKTIIVAALALLSSVAVSAQERMSAEQREKAIAERIGSAADRKEVVCGNLHSLPERNVRNQSEPRSAP